MATMTPNDQETAARRALAEAVRAACLRALLDGYEEAGLAGLCGEGRWELAIDATRTLDLEPLIRGAPPAADPRG